MDTIVASRPRADMLTRGSYLTAAASRADSFWVPDHLNGLFPRSLWEPEFVGVSKIVPTADAYLEPWTTLGYLAARNRIGRLSLGVGVTDTGRRNPAVTAPHTSHCAMPCSNCRRIAESGPISGSRRTVRECFGPPVAMVMPGFPAFCSVPRTTPPGSMPCAPRPPMPEGIR
jgi:hypothetical protein